jgi:predicted kinase
VSGDGAALVLVTGLQGTGKTAVAEGVGDALAAPVFAWDWFMAALTPFEPVQRALREMDVETYRSVGWALLLQQARAHLRRNVSVVLDGLARDGEISAVRAVARELDVRSFVVLTTCTDPQVQKSRIDGRSRGIPGWHELTWEHVEATRNHWVRPADIDLEVDETRPIEEHVAAVVRRLGR